MRAVRTLIFVLLSVGMAAPLAASPRLPAAAWPGVSDVLLNVAVAAPVAASPGIAAWPGDGLNDSEQPGSVLVFPKYRIDTQNTTDQGVVPNTEFEISVKCPKNPDGTPFDCTTLPDFPDVHLKGHWVCAGDRGPEQPGICHESDFEVNTTVNGTLYLTTETLADPVTGLGGVNQANGIFTKIPRPPCEDFPEQDGGRSTSRQNEAYLIVWVIDAGLNPIKFDGLVGDAILRTGPDFDDNVRETYNALPIQAGDFFGTGDRTAADIGGALAFDGSHYKQVTGTIIGTVRYPGRTFATAAAKTANTATGRILSKLSLLTLDVLSNRVNDVTFVDLDFFNEAEVHHSAATTFVCYVTRDFDGSQTFRRAPIDPFLNNRFGRKGLVVSGPAQRLNGTRVSLVGLLEVLEEPDAGGPRAYANPLFNDGTPVTTTFFPSGVLP